MTKILNLDEFESSADKKIVINGKSHNFIPYSVGKFIDQLKEMEGYSGRTDVPVSEYMQHMVNTVKGAFPSIPDEDLNELTMEKIKKISDFIRGDMQAEAVAGLEAVDPEAAAEKKD